MYSYKKLCFIELIPGSKVIDSIIITYDDGSEWSYGSGGGQSSGKTLVLSDNEFLVCT